MKWKKGQQEGEVYLPLAFEPGGDAQCDWGEAVVVMGGREERVQVCVMRMCYSRRLFVMAFPTGEERVFFDRACGSVCVFWRSAKPDQ